MKFLPYRSKNLNKIKDDVNIIEMTLDSFGLSVKVEEVDFAKDINQTYIDARPKNGTKFNSIINLRKDIAFRLKIRLEDFSIEPHSKKDLIRFALPKSRYIEND